MRTGTKGMTRRAGLGAQRLNPWGPVAVDSVLGFGGRARLSSEGGTKFKAIGMESRELNHGFFSIYFF